MSELKIRPHEKGVKLSAKMEWACVHDKTLNVWVGICDDLGLTVQAPTQRELHEDIWGAMESLFSNLLEENKLEAFLASHGWDREKSVVEKVSDLLSSLPVNIFVPEEGHLAGAAA